MKDDLGVRMKGYESVETKRQIERTSPINVRIDGRGFSRFTKGFAKPFDDDLSKAMQETCKHLVDKTSARIGYVQSDEINLVYHPKDITNDKEHVFFDGKIQKMTSVLAGLATIKFAMEMSKTHKELVESRLPHFDCRVWEAPSVDEASNNLVWRYMDAKRNSISMVAQSHFPHKVLFKKSQVDMMDMLVDIGVDFYSYDAANRNGSFFKREPKTMVIDQALISALPGAHNLQVGDVVTRTIIEQHVFEDFISIPHSERVYFIFGEENGK